MKSIVRGAMLLGLAGTAVLAVACASGAPDVRTAGQEAFMLPPLTPVSCPDFQLEATTFTVDEVGGRFLVQPDHWLEFDPDAVSESTQFTVRKGNRTSSPHYWAQVEIIREGSATEFAGDVMLDLSYASCDGLDPSELVLMKTNPPRKNVGGRNDRARQVVRALVPHLSMFAIAR